MVRRKTISRFRRNGVSLRASHKALMLLQLPSIFWQFRQESDTWIKLFANIQSDFHGVVLQYALNP